MWGPLIDPGFIKFYEELQQVWRDDDWQPMIRAIKYVQAQTYSANLFAFTSLAQFNVTTASSYDVYSDHHAGLRKLAAAAPVISTLIWAVVVSQPLSRPRLRGRGLSSKRRFTHSGITPAR
jgi:hypothetical protein